MTNSKVEIFSHLAFCLLLRRRRHHHRRASTHTKIVCNLALNLLLIDGEYIVPTYAQFTVNPPPNSIRTQGSNRRARRWLHNDFRLDALVSLPSLTGAAKACARDFTLKKIYIVSKIHAERPYAPRKSGRKRKKGKQKSEESDCDRSCGSQTIAVNIECEKERVDEITKEIKIKRNKYAISVCRASADHLARRMASCASTFRHSRHDFSGVCSSHGAKLVAPENDNQIITKCENFLVYWRIFCFLQFFFLFALSSSYCRNSFAAMSPIAKTVSQRKSLKKKIKDSKRSRSRFNGFTGN